MTCVPTRISFSLARAPLLALAGLFPLPFLAGCGVSSSSIATSSPISSSPSAPSIVNGRVDGGQQPVQNASIYLYAAGATGNGTGAVNLLTAPVSTTSLGNFTFPGYICPSSSTQVYIVASGGNPGISATTNNSALLMMAALGDCGNLTPSSFIDVNEVTTVAATWALAQFLGPNANIGSSPTNATGLRNAFLIANNLVNTATGLPGGASLPTGATIESAKLYSLANVIAACVNTAGGAACSPLFSAATEAGVTPSTTLDAALAIVRNPGSNLTSVFNVAAPASPFLPALNSPPNDWTMSITYTGGGIAAPTVMAVDSTGSIWAANYTSVRYAGTVAKLSPNGLPASATGFADPALYESLGIAVDILDNVWITNEESHSTNSGFGTVSRFNSSGQLLSGTGYISSIYFPYSIAADSNGTMWVADYGHSQASLLDTSGNSLIGPNGYSSAQLPLPVGVAIDGFHNAWFASQASASKVTTTGAITEYPCCRVTSAIAIDGNGGVWVSDFTGSALVQLSAAGTILQSLSGSGGLYYPEGVAIDGAGAAWVANYHGDSISGFKSSTGGTPSTPLSPSYGLGLDAGLLSPFGLALDASGNVWVANFAGNEVTQFVGLASPVKTPLLGPPTQP